MVEGIKRQTAYKCTINTINRGTFVKKTGWESSYIMTEYGDFSRVNIIAVVVGKEDSGIIVDDGTGQINARFFENNEQLEKIIIGDVVILIGKPRDYNNQLYIAAEIVKKIEHSWIEYRKHELKLVKKIRDLNSNNTTTNRPTAKILEPEIVESETGLSIKERVYKTIKNLDKGNGASIEDVLKISKLQNGEEIISDMMMRGEIYEFKAGHIKLM
jgi:RPA family protein